LLDDIYRPLGTGTYYGSTEALPKPSSAVIPPAIIRTSTKSAEIIKHASNAFLAMKISFINAVANICESVGADIEEVCEGIGSDTRIGHKFLRPGVGYGGSCFPKDVSAFQVVANECGYDFSLLKEVTRVNEQQRVKFLRKIREALWTIKGKKLAVLGLAFKGGTDDIRESPAISVIQELLKEGCEVRAFDPAAMDRVRELRAIADVDLCESIYEAARGADALVILTDWSEFACLDFPALYSALSYPIVIDGRNLFDPAVMATNGFHYYSVGRPDAHPTPTAGIDKEAVASRVVSEHAF
jgi:UDPglucose 6-dehydrogenase